MLTVLGAKPIFQEDKKPFNIYEYASSFIQTNEPVKSESGMETFFTKLSDDTETIYNSIKNAFSVTNESPDVQ